MAGRLSGSVMLASGRFGIRSGPFGRCPRSRRALLTDSTKAFLAGRLMHWLGGQVIQGPLPRVASGVVYIGLGVSTALVDRHQVNNSEDRVYLILTSVRKAASGRLRAFR